jgi:hypothetical protein
MPAYEDAIDLDEYVSRPLADMRIRSQVWARFVGIEGCAGIVVVRWFTSVRQWESLLDDLVLLF